MPRVRYDASQPRLSAPPLAHGPNHTQDHQAGRSERATEGPDYARQARAARQGATQGTDIGGPRPRSGLDARFDARRLPGRRPRLRRTLASVTASPMTPRDAQRRSPRTHVAQRRARPRHKAPGHRHLRRHRAGAKPAPHIQAVPQIGQGAPLRPARSARLAHLRSPRTRRKRHAPQAHRDRGPFTPSPRHRLRDRNARRRRAHRRARLGTRIPTIHVYRNG